jgi:hypothetical protein
VLAVAVAGLLALGGYAAFGTTPPNVYTGCLKAGQINSVKIGSTPSSPCVKPAVQISWNQTGPPGTNGTNGTNGFSSLTKTSAEPAGANCADGGQKVETGLDNGDGGGTANDGILQAGEVDATSYVCNGAKGDTGDPGPNSPSVALQQIGATPAGFASTTTIDGYTLSDHCSYSGGTGTITLSLSYNGGSFNFAGGGVKGSTPFSFEYDTGNGLDSSYTIVSDSSTAHTSGQVEFEAGHYGSDANVIAQLGYAIDFLPGNLADCVVFGSIQPTQ